MLFKPQERPFSSGISKFNSRPQAIATLSDLGIAQDDPRVNRNGGAIALGWEPIKLLTKCYKWRSLMSLDRSGHGTASVLAF